MYGLPKNFDASFLAGHALEMVCFNATQIYLHFNGQVTITIEGAFSYQSVTLKPPVTQSNLMLLVGHVVSEAAGDESGTLTLVFDNGHVLKCLDSSKNYESYQIRHGNKAIIV